MACFGIPIQSRFQVRLKWCQFATSVLFLISAFLLLQAKGIAGNIVHAVASTNAMAAGLIVLDAFKVCCSHVVVRTLSSSFHPIVLSLSLVNTDFGRAFSRLQHNLVRSSFCQNSLEFLFFLSHYSLLI
jgi:hypothetical protein